MEDPPDFELMANRFDRLVRNSCKGSAPHLFPAWEVHLLLDLQECRLTRSRRDETLRAIRRWCTGRSSDGELPPVRFSNFVGQRARKLALVPPPSHATQDPAAFNS